MTSQSCHPYPQSSLHTTRLQFCSQLSPYVENVALEVPKSDGQNFKKSTLAKQ